MHKCTRTGQHRISEQKSTDTKGVAEKVIYAEFQGSGISNEWNIFEFSILWDVSEISGKSYGKDRENRDHTDILLKCY